jgi:hypothetical protein
MLNLSHLEMIKASQIIAVVDLSTAISMRQAKLHATKLCKNAEVVQCKGTPKSAVVLSTPTGSKVVFLSISAASVKSRISYGKKVGGISINNNKSYPRKENNNI